MLSDRQSPLFLVGEQSVSLLWAQKKCISLSLIIFLLTTCIITWVLSRTSRVLPRQGIGKEPPAAPTWIPYLQHLPSFLRNPNGTFAYWRREYPRTPFTLSMMNTKFYIFGIASTASHICSRSRDYVFEPVVESMMKNGLGLPPSDLSKFHLPLKQHSLLSAEELNSKEFLSTNHKLYLRYLTSSTLDEVMRVYVEKFHLVLVDLFSIDNWEWVTVDYHELMRRTIFDSSVLTFFGTRLGELWPNMWDDWRIFNDAAFVGVRSNLSFWLRPRALMARERMLRAFERWCDVEVAEWDDSGAVWNEKWGIRMNWEREILGRDSGFTHRGRACLHAGFLFVILTNSAPMATWFTWCILRSPGGVNAFRREIEKLVLQDEGRPDHELRFDVPALKNNQYIQGMWKEALRTGSASTIARVVVRESELEGFKVKPGNVVMVPVQLLHFDPQVFLQPEKIDPERWILSDLEDEVRAVQLQKQNSNLRSFGGGTGLCSGRYVAEQEIISVVSTVLLLFDMEFLTPIEDFKLDPRSIGIMSPRRNPVVRLRRRHFK